MSLSDHTGPGEPAVPDREGLAAEYALGTLDAMERAEVTARLDVDSELAAAVARWDALLAPLALGVTEVAPPAHLWQALSRRLDMAAQLRASTNSPAAPVQTAARGGGAWRGLAIAASLAAIALGGLLARDRLAAPAAPEGPLVAALSADGKAPAFLVTVDVTKRELSIRRVSADAPSGKAHELWLVSDKVGKPVSLGLVGGEAAAAKLAAYDPPTFEGATYAISLEPEGGSPTGQPTGPVVFSGKLEALPEKPAREPHGDKQPAR